MLKVFIRYFVNFFVNGHKFCSPSSLSQGRDLHRGSCSVQREGLADSAGLQARPQTLYNHAARKFFMVNSWAFSALVTEAIICWQKLTFHISIEMCRLTDWLLPGILLLSEVCLELMLLVFIFSLFVHAGYFLLSWMPLFLACSEL